jgi:hypothetical protein
VNASGTNRTRFKRAPFRILRYPIPNDLLTAEPRIVDFQTDFLFIQLRERRSIGSHCAWG